ncbi:MAG TPA: hypothetical protein VMS37_15760, partial [Verrucomicrobiae bacterium]|nr:hypothetical protein [Verrucomicrobiae bacterium]
PTNTVGVVVAVRNVSRDAEPFVAAGETAPRPVHRMTNPPGSAIFAGLSPQFVGVNQINVSLPPGTPAGNSVSLQIQMGGVTTSSAVTIAVNQ